jgi:hypothetical protein
MDPIKDRTKLNLHQGATQNQTLKRPAISLRSEYRDQGRRGLLTTNRIPLPNIGVDLILKRKSVQNFCVIHLGPKGMGPIPLYSTLPCPTPLF